LDRAAEVVRHVGANLPVEPVAFYYFRLCNRLFEKRLIDQHPVNYPSGAALLENWISQECLPRHWPNAWFEAASALRFLEKPKRERLVELACAHQHPSMRLLGARAAATWGRKDGVSKLAEFCLDYLRTKRSCEYLRELGREEAIPERARTELFKAEADVCLWLFHPVEFNCVPDELELVDSRELYWPPTQDRRKLWLIKYIYHDYLGERKEGVACSGSTTIALFEETSPDMPPLEIYARHCRYELQSGEEKHQYADLAVQDCLAMLLSKNPDLKQPLDKG
jgi:hypothetical protein